ncbi:GRIP and coiled-coil domain-containing protein 2 [Rana temporaria]|uniref:GRIP and coiled-coil domain-containing protein 2 n=1 Tax=Rana temporaria TaxID=8407 RepID=UPI001AACDE16|nr:GRIP and coiled-coil domain-containing protein 2 [Rana temporaria]
MEGTGQDGVSSPATPGTSKSKLDTLPKEDLIKFAKKQIVVIQKVKLRCTELEKEIEILKSKPVKEETDDVLQALTERLDMVLLEKAENQQQLISLKKEYAKTKEEAESAIKNATEVHQNMECSNNALLQEIEVLKNELLQTQNNHKTDVDAIKKELQDALVKQKELNDSLSLQEKKEIYIRKLEEEVQHIHLASNDKINSLDKTLQAAVEENNQLTARLKDAQATSEKYNGENQALHAEVLKLQNLHHDEVASLMQQLERSTKQSEQEKIVLQDLIKQYVEKEKMLQEEMRADREKNAQEIEILRKKLEENRNVPEIQPTPPVCSDDGIHWLENLVTDLESQQSLLRDELTYTSNLKIGLEKDVQHLKSDYFHEKEDLEFKINELQLAIEDYNALIEKLQAKLQTTTMEYEQLHQQRTEDIKNMREQHNREMKEMERSITSCFENDRLSFEHEIILLKEQVDKINKEKEEAVSSYEGLRETFLSLQAELGESAGKISQEFETMKQQQATDVSELQQKLRSAYKDKNDLLETVNRLKCEVELLSTKQEECDELQGKITHLKQINEEVTSSLQQKELLLKDFQSKISETSAENAEMSSTLKASVEEIQRLQEMYKCEQDRVKTLQQEAETLAADNEQLKQTVDALTQKLQESVLTPNESENENFQLQLTHLKKDNEDVVASLHEKESFIKDLELKMKEMATENAEMSTSIEISRKEILELQQSCQNEEAKALDFQHKFEEHQKINAQLKQSVETLTQQLQESVGGRDQSLSEMKVLQQQVDMLVTNKEKLETDAKRWQDDASRLQEEKEVISRDFARLVCEHSTCETSKDELDNVRTKFQMALEGKDKVSILLEQKERYVEELKTELFVLQDLLAVECLDPDIGTVLQGINKAVLQLKEEKQNAVLQTEETSVHINRLQEEYEAQCSELRALLSDYSKEKVILKKELEETLADKEALQRDLFEMKNALEKLKLENQELLLRIEDLTSNLNSLQEKNDADSKAHVQDELNVTENKESAVAAQEANAVQETLLKSEATRLECDTLVSDLQKKIDNLEKECKEREEKCNKIKAVAIKARKELDVNKKEVQSLKKELERVRAEKDQIKFSMKDLVQGAESYQNLMVVYDKQMEQLENEKERASSTEHQLGELSRRLHSTLLEHEKLNSVNEDLVTRMETLQSNNRLLEAQILELQRAKTAVDKDLEAEKLIKEQKIKDHNSALKQIEELQQHLQKEKNKLQKTTQELELLRKDAQKSSLMDMEMADYERLVKELNQKLTHKSSQLEDLEQEIYIQKQKQETLQQEISTLQTTIEQHEECSTKMKQLLVKTKKELADSKQAESDQLIIQASLKGELEACQQHVEVYKIQVAELTSEKHKVQEQLRALTEQHQRAANLYQQKLLALQEECTAAKAEQATVTAEFESYKVRVHNVLKQQKNKSASQAEHEVFRQEREHLQTMLDQVKNKLQDAQHSLQMNTAELQALQSEHDMLVERHNKMLQETVTKEAELREKLCTVQSENMVLKTEHTQVVSQLGAQNEAQRNNFRDQVRRLQDDHRKTVETLQQQLSKVEAQLFQVKSEVTVTNPTGSQQPVKSLRERRPNDLVLDLYSVAREEGEGMETTDTDSVSSANTHIASLEQLLGSSDLKTAVETPQWQPEISREELNEKLNTASKSVDHLSGLLHETEATNAMLMEQITLLKNEIRRLERNQEREKSVANLEYLKNVLLQFIFLKAGSERQRLLPVIDTMLQLSPDEKGKLYAIAQGEEESASQPAGWASYLHSWSGLR